MQPVPIQWWNPDKSQYLKKRSHIPNPVQACYILQMKVSTQIFSEWHGTAIQTSCCLSLMSLLIMQVASHWSILNITAKIFDPLRLLGPFVISLKIMFRRLCMEKVDWDEVLENKLVKQSLLSLEQWVIDRCYFMANATPTKIQLHGFCDASVEAYAAVLYVRTVFSDNSVSMSMLASKTRVCLLKAQTIPRLELLAAVILSRLFTAIRDYLSLPVETFLWTDSMVILCWLQINKPCKQYVSSQVSENKRRALVSLYRGTKPSWLTMKGYNCWATLSGGKDLSFLSWLKGCNWC